MTTSTLTFQPVLLSPGHLRLDIFFHDPPAQFLGMGFDLVSSLNSWDFDHYELGSAFEIPEDVLALAVQKEQPKRLVFGLSLKGKELKNSLPLQSEEVTHLYFSLKDADRFDFKLQNPVLSVLENGTRHDLTDVRWQSSALQSLVPAQNQAKPVNDQTPDPQDMVSNDSDLEISHTSSSAQSAQPWNFSSTIPPSAALSDNIFDQNLLIPGLLLLFMILSFVVWIFFVRRKV